MYPQFYSELENYFLFSKSYEPISLLYIKSRKAIMLSFLFRMEVQMKFQKLLAPVVVSLSLSLVPVFADGVTDGAVPCSDVQKNGESYGCLENQNTDYRNTKMKCVSALKPFQIPEGKKPAEPIKKPGKIMKGEDTLAMGHEDGSLSISDKEKNYKLDKDLIKSKIAAKFGNEASNMDEVDLAIMTAKGKIKIKVKKDQNANQADGFKVGDWEKLNDDAASSDKEVLITLGNSHSDENAHNPLKEELSKDVEKFDENVQKKVADIEENYTKKISEVDQVSELSGMEKVTIKRNLRDEKENKKLRWLRHLEQKQKLIMAAKEACAGLPTLVSQELFQNAGALQPQQQRATASGGSADQ